MEGSTRVVSVHCQISTPGGEPRPSEAGRFPRLAPPSNSKSIQLPDHRSITPFTPVHLGPGLLIGLLCLRWLDLPTFLAASALVDGRAALVFLGLLDGPLHGPLHPLLGAAVLASVLAVATIPLRPRRDPLLARLRASQPTAPARIVTAALVGSRLHVGLDAMLYADVAPFAPVSAANPALGLLGVPTVYVGCVVAGLLGLGLYAATLVGLIALVDADAP
ncbi:MAG: hypothetical protein ABEJ73_07300 [Haloplanus sp.]